jgi:ABC-type multidrug transport system fused ATPase/permease subunit
MHCVQGLVAQDTQLFAGTIEENIAYGMESYTQDDLISAAKKANAHDFIMAFEEDYKVSCWLLNLAFVVFVNT